ncbi:MAG: class I SAM-dependent methyltransferase [Anaerolineae bacterium]|nr:class I SAM-dependent methyltransferase [Anaerolineae bacterium]
METVNCLFGHKETSQEFMSAKDRLGVSDEVFHVYRCQTCGLWYLNPRPTQDEIGAFYPYSEYRAEFSPAIDDELSSFKRWNRRYSLQKVCRFVEAHYRAGTLLDIGCATGNFLAEMRQRGNWEVFGLDANLEAVNYARERFHLDVFHGVLDQAHYSSAMFDVVTMWNVIEHLHDPCDILRQVHTVLKPGGALIFSLPNANSIDAKIFKSFWVGFDPPRHLYTFTIQTVKQLLHLTGFELVQHRHITGSYHSWTASALQFLARRYPKMKWLSKMVTSLPMRGVLWPYLRFAETINRGAILSIMAKKF